MPDHLLGHAVTPNPPCSVYATEQPAGGNSRAGQPNVKVLFNPVQHRHRSYVTALSDEIDNGPVLFSLLQVGEVQFHGFMPPQAAGEQHSQKGADPFALQSLRIGRLAEGFALLGCQPVPRAHSAFLYTLHASDTGGKAQTPGALSRVSSPLSISSSAVSAPFLGGLKPQRVFATGHSQSAVRLATYLNSVHPFDPVFDAVIVHGGGSKIRTDLRNLNFLIPTSPSWHKRDHSR